MDTPTLIIGPEGALTAEEALSDAQRALEEQQYPQAAEKFARVVEVAQNDSERMRALWGWATAEDLAGEPEQALQLYSRYVAESEPGAEQDQARVRVVRLLVFLERYDEAARVAERVTPPQTDPLARVAVLSARALAAVSAGRHDDAELSIGRARSIIEDQGWNRLETIPRDAAAVYFALGELRAEKARAIHFDPLPSDFLDALERRCQWILDAQAAYSDAMRANDAHWSSMAGVQVSSLYSDLHKELTNIAPPQSADSEERKRLFEGAMRLRYSILLRKAVAMLEATVALQQRSGEGGRWAERAAQALALMQQAKQQEDAAIDALPYTRAQLQQVLDQMAEQAKRDAKNAG